MPHQRLKPETFLDKERLAAFKDIIPEAFADNKINWSTLKDALGGELEDEENPMNILASSGRGKGKRGNSQAVRAREHLFP